MVHLGHYIMSEATNTSTLSMSTLGGTKFPKLVDTRRIRGGEAETQTASHVAHYVRALNKQGAKSQNWAYSTVYFNTVHMTRLLSSYIVHLGGFGHQWTNIGPKLRPTHYIVRLVHPGEYVLYRRILEFTR